MMNAAFISAWLQENLPPPGNVANVAELAARMRADAAAAGIELEVSEAPPFVLEDTICAAIGARLEVGWGRPVYGSRIARAA
jgi:hypothetical protein